MRNMKNKIYKQKICLLLMFIVCGVLSQGYAVFAVTRTLNVETPTQEEIRAYIEEHTGNSATDTTYSTEPITEAPYAAGALSSETLQYALDALNEIRYIAGIFDEVVLDSTYTAQCQAGTLVNCVNGVMSHTPTQPSDMSVELYNQGYTGMSRSNIGWGYSSLVSAVQHGWMADEDDYNITVLGHRRWCLNPKMGKTGFGKTDLYTAMYSMDSSHTVSQATTVVWPAQNMPIDYFDGSYPWSISSDTAFASDVKVTLTYLDGDSDASNDRIWKFSASSSDGYFNYDQQGYGQSHCLIFRPDDINMYYDNDQYKVQVTEDGVVTLEYTVSFFDLEPIPEDVTLSLAKTYGSMELKNDGFYWSATTITVSDASIDIAKKMNIYSSDDSIAQAMIGTPSNGKATVFIKTNKEGVAQLTFELAKNIKAVYKVTVGDGGNHVHNYVEISVTEATCTKTGLRTFECEGCGVPSTEVIPTKEHSVSDWIVDTEPSYTATGSRHKECTVCHTIVESESIECLLAESGTNTDSSATEVTVEVEDDNYAVDSTSKMKEVTYSGPQDKSVKSVTIPSTIEVDGITYQVTAINENAFIDCKQLKNVKLGKNITKIGKNAFSGCSKLTKVTLSSKLTSIESGAFAKCTSLKSIVIPKSVKKIGSKAFYKCKKLKKITIKTASLKSSTVGSKAFSGIDKKATVKVPKKKANAYKKLLKKKGLPKKATIKK